MKYKLFHFLKLQLFCLKKKKKLSHLPKKNFLVFLEKLQRVNKNCTEVYQQPRLEKLQRAGVSQHHGGLIESPPETPRTITALSY